MLPLIKQPLPHGRGSDQSRDREGAVAGVASVFEEGSALCHDD